MKRIDNYKNCLICGKKFRVANWQEKRGMKYCSKKCADIARIGHRFGGPEKKKRIKTNCLICNKQIELIPSQVKRGEGKYCSPECFKKRVITDESKKKMSKNSARYWLGKKNTKTRGENHWKWIEDRTKIKQGDRERISPKHKEWSIAVKNRDRWKCKINNCDCRGKVVAHHILGFTKNPELRYEINNGITLCQYHHPKKRIDEIKLTPFLKELVMQMK